MFLRRWRMWRRRIDRRQEYEHVNRELAEHREDHTRGEEVLMRPLGRELLQWLRATDTKEEHRDREGGNCHLRITPLDTIQIEYTHRIGRDE